MWMSAALAVGLASPVPTAMPPPLVSRCELGTTQRVALHVDNVPREALRAVVRIGLYGKNLEWLADEIAFDGLDAPILRVAGLLDPADVKTVTCTYEGFVGEMDQRGIVEANHWPTGRKSCAQREGLIVDGGPDAEVETVLYGRDWIVAQIGLDIQHFMPNQETNFNGDVFAASIDGGPLQKVVVSGTELQSLSFLFTDLRPGLHQVKYGPFFEADRQEVPENTAGLHNICIRI
jgi:hypothetical protein